MKTPILATTELARRYFEIFVNRRAYTLQSSRPNKDTGKHYYYRPDGVRTKPVALSLTVVRQHLSGVRTVGLYAINPKTQCCKWVAIDADYENALEDLLKLQWELKQDGVYAALEQSRRGGHLWIFAGEPLLAKDCRLYLFHLAKRLKVPVKGAGLADGIELFPKQNEVPAREFGNAIRGPLGIHRGSGKRYWFYGADYTLDAQIAYLGRIKRVSRDEMARFVAGLKPIEEPARHAAARAFSYRHSSGSGHEFRILDYVTIKRKSGRNYWTRCPSCAHAGRDKSGDNLAISVADPRKYRCWAGCSREQIRAALGRPVRSNFPGAGYDRNAFRPS